MKARVRHAVALIGMAVILVMAGACSRSSEGREADKDGTQPEAVPVEVTTIERGPIEAVLRYSTNLEAEERVQVQAKAGGQVQELLVEEGDEVERGQLLLSLEDEPQRIALERTRSQLAKARREYERQQRLHEQNLISEQTFSDATYEVEQLELAMSDAELQLEYTSVEAPISGVVSSRTAKLGDEVAIGQTLFEIVDMDSIVALVYVPERELPRLDVGHEARITVPAAPGQQYQGTVERIAPVVDPRTGTVKVTVDVPRRTGLRPGMYVEVGLVTAVHDTAVLVPKKALLYDDDQIFLFRLVDDRKVERLMVEALLENPDVIEPVSGVSAGDQIVVAGQTGLKDGAVVRLPGDPKPTRSSDDGDDQ